MKENVKFEEENAPIGRQKLNEKKFITVVIDKGPEWDCAELSSRR